ncbi:MAG: alanine--tRNA ligase [Planctomycetaceae bacterium]|nr:alanine--tRNA ligase [Planctomycetaceae bacterium]
MFPRTAPPRAPRAAEPAPADPADGLRRRPLGGPPRVVRPVSSPPCRPPQAASHRGGTTRGLIGGLPEGDVPGEGPESVRTFAHFRGPTAPTPMPIDPQRSAAQVRRQFLDFFAERGHREVPSSPVFPQDDPTLLFTNAGMNQFKDVFLGTGTRDYRRAVDTQKCIRVSGKHNDLEEVGVDTYHHTFFEMLGNWSFGDYFKEDAITWAWQLLTEVWKLPKERLWVTVFGGDPKDGLAADEEAEQLWRSRTDIDPSHVLRFGKKDNFWEMGETGPCGPCTEIHIDRGAPGDDPRDGANPAIGVNAGNERFMEIWNLVFMQFNRMDNGSLVNLPAKSVDTGMGFERVLSVLQGKRSNYDTDLFAPIFRTLEQVSGRTYGGSDSRADVAFRVAADHVRAVSSAFADGALPGNVGRGYVLRRLIRRAARFGRQELGLEQPYLHRLVPTVAEVLGHAFPEIRQRVDHVASLVLSEEESFGATLGRGLVRFEELARRVAKAGAKVLPGEQAYELYATYGFPKDLVELMARERELALDAAGWDDAERAHQSASRSEGGFKQLLSAEQLQGLRPTAGTYHHEDTQSLAVETRVQRLFRSADRDTLVLESSPFYPEAGGQVGDSGLIEAPGGGFRFQVDDTQRLGTVVVHLGRAEGDAQPGLAVLAKVDAERRASIRRNHSATHLLHRALKEVLGDHVAQAGSHVGPDRLRFDLSHPKAITQDELERIEAHVLRAVVANPAVRTTVEDLAAAKARGAAALFGEKYDAAVRVVEMGDVSLELCGGTHVRATGDIGAFAIVQERAVQAGVRRIEAVTGPNALALFQEQRRLLGVSAQRLKVPPDELPQRIEALQEQLKEARKKTQAAAQGDLAGALEHVKKGLETRSGVAFGAVDLAGLDLGGLRELSARVKGQSADLCVLLLGRDGERVPWIVLCQGQALERGLAAGDLAKAVAAELGGGGGGKRETAQGQGLAADRVEAALAAFRAAAAGRL